MQLQERSLILQDSKKAQIVLDLLFVPLEWSNALYCFSLDRSRISLDWASSVADILRDLNSSPQWQKVIAAFTKRCIEELPLRLKRTNVFALLVLVGFPEVKANC